MLQVSHWCARPAALSNMSVTEWRQLSGQQGDSCRVYDVDWEGYMEGDLVLRTEYRDCTEWEWDTEDFTATISSEFSLVCDRAYLTGLAQTLYFVGMVLGVITFGVLADYFGRKKVLVPIMLGVSITGAATSLMPNFETFVMGRVLNACLAIAVFETYFTFMLEFVGGRWTTVVGIGAQYIWVLGWLTLAGLAYLFRDWRELMLWSSLPSLLSVLMYWLLPESPRWLLSVGRLEEAERVVREAARYNEITLPDQFKLSPVQREETGKRKTFLDLFRSSNLRTKTLILYYQWFVNSFAYYGLSLNMGHVTGGSDIFLNFTIGGLLEIPSHTAAILSLLYFGRRIPYCSSMFLCGLSLVSTALIPRDTFHMDWAVMVLTLFGKMCITFSWGVLFLYNAELFPTEVRTSGIGSASFVGRFGGMVAPWVEMLGKHHHTLIPPLVFGSTALLASVLALVLPETYGKQLPYTIEEAEKLELVTFKSDKRNASSQ